MGGPSASHDAPRDVAVELLRCPQCGADVPLCDGDTSRCPHCGRDVAIPESYRELRDAHRVADADRAKVEAAYARLGKPPGALLRAVDATARLTWRLARGPTAEWAVGCLVLVWWPFVLLVALMWPMVAQELFDHLAYRLGFHLAQVVGVRVFLVGSTVTACAFFLGGPILARYRTKTSEGREALRACLCAAPPTTRGGPSRCHGCGAPLAVEPGALGVRCLYCGSDNLVALPSEWAARVSAKSRQEHTDVVALLEGHASEVRDARSTALWSLAGAVVLGTVASLLYVHLEDAKEPMAWWRAVRRSPRPVWVCDALDHARAETLAGHHLVVRLSPEDCSDYQERCQLSLYAPLKKGERFDVITPDLGQGTLVEIATDTMAGNEWNRAPAWKYVNDPDVQIGYAEYVAPYSGWFRMTLVVPRLKYTAGQAVDVPIDALVTVKPPGSPP